MFKILFNNKGVWQELIGHGCTTIEQAEAYVQMSPASFHLLLEGEEWPAPPEPVVDLRQERINQLSPETRRKLADRIHNLMGDSK